MSWKSLDELLAVGRTRTDANPVETTIQVLRANKILLPVQIPPASSEDDAGTLQTTNVAGLVAGCRVCNIKSFPQGVSEQRAHFRSDWHVHNLTSKDATARALTEQEYLQLKADSQEGEEGEEDDTYSSSQEEEEEEAGEQGAMDYLRPSHSPLSRFPLEASSSSSSTSSSVLVASMYTLVCPSPEACMRVLGQEGALTWGVILYRSGHFAAAVFENFKLVQHKTEHRYTTRKKQGGSQASHDVKSHKAKSAGAQLRRYGEQTMRERVAKVLAEWPQWKQCSLIVYAIPERARSLFFSKKTASALERADGRFSRHDARLQRIPFMTQRPSLEECERVVQTLQRVQVFLHTPQVVSPQTEADSKASSPPPKQESEEEIALRKAKLDEAKYREMGYFDRELHVFCREQPDGNHLLPLIYADQVDSKALNGQTALHICTELGKLEFCRTLLFDMHADVTIADLNGRVPYQLAKLAPIRLLFREYRGSREDVAGESEEEFWRASQIPEPPRTKTEEELEAKREREREKRKRQAQKKREAKEEAEAQKLLPPPPPPPPPPPEGPLCTTCGASIKGKKKKDLFFQGEHAFCTQPCMREHSRKVMAAALDRRL